MSPKVRKCSSLCTYGEHVENFKIFKNEKCAHRRCTDWSMCEKKCDTWAKALPYSLNFDRPIATTLMERARLTSVRPSVPSRHGSGPGWRAASPGRPPSLPPLLITLATKSTGNLFLTRRRACCSDFGIFFATVLGIMHRIAGRVSRSLRQLFLKRFSKMSASGIEHMSVQRESNPAAGLEPLLQPLCSRGSGGFPPGNRTRPRDSNPY